MRNFCQNGRLFAGENLRQWFWRSVVLTGNQTDVTDLPNNLLFWRSVVLTGNQTANQ